MAGRLRLVALACLLPALVAACTTTAEQAETPAPSTPTAPAPPEPITPPPETPEAPAVSGLEDADAGYSLRYPDDWQASKQIVATEFGTGARCRSVEIVDFEPPPGSGPSAQILRSFVQICAKAAGDSTLDDFMARIYGEALGDLFQRTEMGGLPAYRTRKEGEQSTIFVQTDRRRLEIVSVVVADPDQRAERLAQIRTILESFSVI